MPRSLGLKGVQEQRNEAYVLTLPGKNLDSPWLINKKKKFHSRYGQKAAMDAVKQLEKEKPKKKKKKKQNKEQSRFVNQKQVL